MGEQKSIHTGSDRLPKLIALNGPIGAGKDTVAGYLGTNFGYHILGFSDPIYEGLYRLNTPVVVGSHSFKYLRSLVDEFGWDLVKRRCPAVRAMLQIQGTENGRMIHGENCWVYALQARMEELGKPRYVIRDLRFPNEEQFVREQGGEIWRVEGRRDPGEHTHVSESYTIQPDKLILNDGTLPRLYQRVNTLMSWYLE